MIRFVAVLFLLSMILNCQPASAQLITRSDDVRPTVPEKWQADAKTTLQLNAGGSSLFGNLDTDTRHGGLKLRHEVAHGREWMLEGSAFRMLINDVVIQDRWKGSLLFIQELKPWLNVFGGVTLARNSITQLHLRSTLSLPGLCRHKLFPENFDLFLVSLSPTFEREEYDNGSKVNATRATLRLTLEKKLSASARLGLDSTWTPDVKDSDDYRTFVEPWLELVLVPGRSSLKISYADEFDSRPLAGLKKRDRAVMAGLTYTLSR